MFYKLTVGDNSDSAFQWEQGSPAAADYGFLILGQDVQGIILGAQYHLNASIYVALNGGCKSSSDALQILVGDLNQAESVYSFLYPVCTAPPGVYVDVSYSFYGSGYMASMETLQFIFNIKSLGYVRVDNVSIQLG